MITEAKESVSSGRSFPVRKHLNKLRWATLAAVFGMLILLPCLSVYQNYVAAHAYDMLLPGEKRFYDVMEALSSPFTSDPEHGLDVIKGTTWSGSFFGIKLSDPLALAGQSAASLDMHWPFLLSTLIPIVLTVFLGRFYCGWICPATFFYELNTNLGAWLHNIGLPVGNRRFDRRIKYLVLVIGLVLSAVTGSVMVAAVYPPAIIGREIYYAIALGGFGVGIVFFMLTLLFDLLVARRGFCRYLCPGGALYSLLGRYRLLRIQREVKDCNDCAKCTAVCEFELDPMRDDFGQECNNCTACIAICPTDALVFTLNSKDLAYQGPGHLGHLVGHGTDQKETD
ncbi:MAG: (4Fe-4S)-binding protein [Gammaproteobacteria bacterium RBG_16_51_14]|nr:MAG: (4Fe-4S)-binding protein [Gammaproteobacteria bacterium RBG_16_51_14]